MVFILDEKSKSIPFRSNPLGVKKCDLVLSFLRHTRLMTLVRGPAIISFIPKAIAEYTSITSDFLHTRTLYRTAQYFSGKLSKPEFIYFFKNYDLIKTFQKLGPYKNFS